LSKFLALEHPAVDIDHSAGDKVGFEDAKTQPGLQYLLACSRLIGMTLTQLPEKSSKMSVSVVPGATAYIDFSTCSPPGKPIGQSSDSCFRGGMS
jgi:hypothetical protein